MRQFSFNNDGADIIFKHRCKDVSGSVSLPMNNLLYQWDYLKDSIKNFTENIGRRDMQTIEELIDETKEAVKLYCTDLISEIESEDLRQQCEKELSLDVVVPIERFPEPCYTYVFQTEIGMEKFAKIGMSKNPQRRIASLQKQNPTELREVVRMKWESKQAAIDAEKKLHTYFSPWRQRFNGSANEWFSGAVLPVIEKYKDADWNEIITGNDKRFTRDLEALYERR